MDKLKDTIRSKTRRTDGRSLCAICEDLSRTFRGWFEYFKHSKANVLGPSMPTRADGCAASFESVGKRKGADVEPIINDGQMPHFTTAGLFSLKQAHAVACRSS